MTQKTMAVDPAMDYPSVTLSNGVLTALVYVPDTEQGYYRGIRFDRSGLIGQATLRGHTFFGELRTPHNPLGPDDVAGPVEEFGMRDPLGYVEAATNGAFIKIGVGHLQKTGNTEYFFNGAYPLVKAAPWAVTTTVASVRFEQTLDDPSGWGYAYVKTVRLSPGRPVMEIDHELRNTGARAIATDHYSHNMFRFDGWWVGRGYRIEFPFEPSGSVKSDQARIEGREIVLQSAPLQGALFMPLTGWAGAGDNAATIRHAELGMALTVATPLALCRYNFYAEAAAICPEPFIPIRLQPGEAMHWTTTLTFEAP